MRVTIPDLNWYRTNSAEKNAPPSCPYANVHKCHRYYASTHLLGQVGVITSISNEKKEELDNFWSGSKLLPVIAEDDTSIGVEEQCLRSLSNFCPEVSFAIFRYYASYLSKYADETDKNCGHRTAKKDALPNDWRYEWGSLSACHFLDCAVYGQIQDFNSRKIGKFDGLVHANVVTLIGRMERCLDSGDPTGVLHAASNILETMAKDIVKSDSVGNQPLGGFIKKYEIESALPDEVKSVVGAIYKLRNVTPLSGHGSTGMPTLTMRDAIVIAAATKFVVEIEYRISNHSSPA